VGILDVLSQTAEQLVDTFGVYVIWLPVSAAKYDPQEGEQSASRSAITVKGVWVDYRRGEVDGDTIRFGDRALILAARSTDGEPMPDDLIRYGGSTYRIVTVVPTQATDEIAMYELQLRK
jgi:hypothetical protein